MILNIIAFKNVNLVCFCNPAYDDHKPEDVAVQLHRACKEDDKARAYWCKFEMWHLGSFNDETGEICLLENGPVMITDFTCYAPTIPEEVKDNA